jgi:hypothetical protein
VVAADCGAAPDNRVRPPGTVFDGPEDQLAARRVPVGRDARQPPVTTVISQNDCAAGECACTREVELRGREVGGEQGDAGSGDQWVELDDIASGLRG